MIARMNILQVTKLHGKLKMKYNLLVVIPHMFIVHQFLNFLRTAADRGSLTFLTIINQLMSSSWKMYCLELSSFQKWVSNCISMRLLHS